MATAGEWPLILNTVIQQRGDTVYQAVLNCSNPDCLCEYPVIDGVPIIVADIRSYIAQQVMPILARRDLDETLESLLGDCCGQGSPYDSQRQYLSTYGFDHYGDLDTAKALPAGVQPGSALRILKQGLLQADEGVCGPIIDLGCAVGRTSFELAAFFDDMVLGVDLNFAMLRLAADLLRNDRVVYPRRRVGLVYETRTFPVEFKHKHKVDFWVCDATCLPFSDATFGFGACINLIDCVPSPHDHLTELARILAPRAQSVFSTPYDWNVNAAPVEAWLGGHSQRSQQQGSSEAMLHALLGGGHRQGIDALEICYEINAFPWQLRLHDRSTMAYQVHLMLLRRRGGA